MENTKNKILVIVDMQNDFIDGSLANKDAQAIVPGICDLIKNWEGQIYYTQDTHQPNYLQTQEGRKLPIEHCIENSAGWEISKSISEALAAKRRVTYQSIQSIKKDTFGSIMLAKYLSVDSPDEVVFVGTCTDICVVSNALLFKAFDPETPIAVYEDLCAGLTPEKHAAALDVMRSCQVDVRRYKESE